MMNNKLEFVDLAIRIIFLLPTTTGILGNISLLYYYLAIYYRECKLKPTDLMLMHLMAANALIVLSTGVPHIMTILGLKDFVNHLGCELLLCLQGFSRSMSICTTCLLSVFQTITISPRKSCRKNHSVKTSKYMGCSIYILWVLNILINSIPFIYAFIKRNSQNMTRTLDYGYCSVIGSDDITNSLYTALVVCPEVFFSLLLTWSSGSMIIILHRHKQRVQHIRSTHCSRRTSPESRATQNVLAVVSTFLAFCTLNSIISGYIALFNDHNFWLMTINHLTSLGFPTFAPFVLMSHYSIGSRFSVDWLRKKNNHLIFL